MQKKGSWSVGGWGGQGGCEPRIGLIVKMPKKVGRGRSVGGGGGGGQGGCEPRIEVIVKMKKKKSEGGPVRGGGSGWV